MTLVKVTVQNFFNNHLKFNWKHYNNWPFKISNLLISKK